MAARSLRNGTHLSSVIASIVLSQRLTRNVPDRATRRKAGAGSKGGGERHGVAAIRRYKIQLFVDMNASAECCNRLQWRRRKPANTRVKHSARARQSVSVRIFGWSATPPAGAARSPAEDWPAARIRAG